MEHVRSHSGFDAQSTIDALAVHLWQSRHHEVHAYEVKVSRSDLRRELANDCDKSAIWREWVEYFWIVAPAEVAHGVELPVSWGLMVPTSIGLRVARSATRLQPKPDGYMPAADLPRSLVASMLRSAAKQASPSVMHA